MSLFNHSSDSDSDSDSLDLGSNCDSIDLNETPVIVPIADFDSSGFNLQPYFTDVNNIDPPFKFSFNAKVMRCYRLVSGFDIPEDCPDYIPMLTSDVALDSNYCDYRGFRYEEMIFNNYLDPNDINVYVRPSVEWIRGANMVTRYHPLIDIEFKGSSIHLGDDWMDNIGDNYNTAEYDYSFRIRHIKGVGQDLFVQYMSEAINGVSRDILTGPNYTYVNGVRFKVNETQHVTYKVTFNYRDRILHVYQNASTQWSTPTGMKQQLLILYYLLGESNINIIEEGNVMINARYWGSRIV